MIIIQNTGRLEDNDIKYFYAFISSRIPIRNRTGEFILIFTVIKIENNTWLFNSPMYLNISYFLKLETMLILW